MSNEKIGIFVATMTGTAVLCAEEIESALTKAGVQSEIHLMDDLDADALSPYEVLVIVSSTYGQGDVPDNGQDMFASIEAGQGLAGKCFATFGLGDRTYSATFCDGARKWDELLAAKGASRFAPLVLHDACSGELAEDVAADWAAGWAPRLKQAA